MKEKSKTLLTGMLLAGILAANFALAATSIVNCSDNCTISDLVNTVKDLINFLLFYAWLFALVFIVVSGIRLVFSAGNEEVVSKARTSLNNAIIGFILILVSFVLINFVIAILSGGNLDLSKAIQLLP